MITRHASSGLTRTRYVAFVLFDPDVDSAKECQYSKPYETVREGSFCNFQSELGHRSLTVSGRVVILGILLGISHEQVGEDK